MVVVCVDGIYYGCWKCWYNVGRLCVKILCFVFIVVYYQWCGKVVYLCFVESVCIGCKFGVFCSDDGFLVIEGDDGLVGYNVCYYIVCNIIDLWVKIDKRCDIVDGFQLLDQWFVIG